jgi:serine/threonine-protein kinase
LQDPTVSRRLLEEARAVNQIRHPNIIDIFSFGTLPDGRPYYVMELLEGENLEVALGHGPLPLSTVLTLMDQLCRTLQAAHTAGFVHRDLKPENLWILRQHDQSLFLKVLDFGIAKNIRPASPSLTTSGQVLGTAHYMAPEQALARPVDARTDIYAIGVILYQILAGVLPFDDPDAFNVVAKQVAEQPKPLSAHRPIPAALEAVVMRCLAKDPAGRPQTVGDLWAELRPAIEAWRPNAKDNSRTTIQAVERSAAHAPSALPGRTKLAFSAGAAALLLVGAVSSYQLLPRRGTPSPPPVSQAGTSLFRTEPSALPPLDAGLSGRTFESRDAGGTNRPDARSFPRARPPQKTVRDDNDNPKRL